MSVIWIGRFACVFAFVLLIHALSYVPQVDMQFCALANLGNSCYVNSVLQVFNRLYTTVASFAASVNVVASSVAPIRVLQDTFTAMREQRDEELRPEAAVAMVTNLSTNPVFLPGRAADAFELGEILLDLVTSKPAGEALCGTLTETQTCSGCHQPHVNTAANGPFIRLLICSNELAVNLARYSMPQLVTGADMRFCATCSKKHDAVVVSEFEPGDVIFFQLRRSHTERVTRPDGAYEFFGFELTQDIDFPEYVAIKDKVFQRVASIHYHGVKSHYTTYFPNGDTGVQIDDAKVYDNVAYDGTTAAVFAYKVCFLWFSMVGLFFITQYRILFRSRAMRPRRPSLPHATRQ